MNKNSKTIIVFCSHLCLNDEMKPYETKEWIVLAENLLENKIQPSDFITFADEDFYNFFKSTNIFKEQAQIDSEIERIKKLIERTARIDYEIEKYEKMGIKIMTRADDIYPKILKTKLGKNCPPLFYYAGNPIILKQKFIGFVGSRNIDIIDEEFTRDTVFKINKKGYGIVSGGAKGVDTISTTTSLKSNIPAVEYISDSMKRKLKNSEVQNYINKNLLLIMSVVNPDAGFDTGMAMARNRLIYAQAAASIIIRADLKKGGTWSGASENLKKRYSPSFCWNHIEYEGNQELIKMGAYPIDETWDGDISIHNMSEKNNILDGYKPKQISIFDEIK
ncbi:MAG: DNA-processing protein DprA [Candidatus Cloacimonetes bacterium]|nr:DNA-processing protein DprA [Candidatus Cloacimonadota bacterium]